MEHPVAVRVRETIARQRLFPARSRIVVAVSGGADSVALLHVLASLRTTWALELHAAHLDHGLRVESSQDAAFVRELSGHLGIPVTLERRDVAARCAREGWSLEDGARRIRYEFLCGLAQRQSASHLAIAHTADDQAETVLMRIIRGTGLLGLGAIPMTRDLGEVQLVRPLLEVWRREIVAYLDAERLTYREDATNQNLDIVRNRIRHELLPLLERSYSSHIKERLVQLAQQSRLDYQYLQQSAARQWKRIAKVTSPRTVRLARSPFLRQSPSLQRQLVRQAVQYVRGDLAQFEFRHWVEIDRLFREHPAGSLVDLPGGIQWRRENDAVVCQRVSPRSSSSASGAVAAASVRELAPTPIA